MFFVKDFIGTASLCAFLLIHLRFCKIAGSSLAVLYNKVTADILCNMFNFHVESLTKNIIRRLSKKGEGGQHGVFSLSHTGCFVLDPALTSTGSNKREGGKEGSSSWTQQSMSPLLVNFIHVSHCCCFTRPPLSSVYTSHLCCEDAALRNQRCHFADAVHVSSKQMSFLGISKQFKDHLYKILKICLQAGPKASLF